MNDTSDGYECRPTKKLRICEGVNLVKEIQDNPHLAVEREQIRRNCYETFNRNVSKFGGFYGDTKTAQLCRSDGMRRGLRTTFARILWTQVQNQSEVL